MKQPRRVKTLFSPLVTAYVPVAHTRSNHYCPVGKGTFVAIVVYNLRHLHEGQWQQPRNLRRLYDETLLAACLQGLVNRGGPRLFLILNEEQDRFWLDLVRREWLASDEITEIKSLPDLLGHFRHSYEDAVVWDENVPATSNIAATIAGADRLLPVRFDTDPESLYQQVIVRDQLLGVRMSFVSPNGESMFDPAKPIPGTGGRMPSTGSAKNNAYRWLAHHYINCGRLNPGLIGYYIDAFWLKCGHAGWPENHTLSNLDYIVANRGTVCDLNVWDDESPIDDPQQALGTDVETLKRILRTCHDRLAPDKMIHVCGFTPWRYKYTNVYENGWNAGGTHTGVATEWRMVELLSCFDAYLDADALDYASMVNASFYQHYKLPAKISQQPKPTARELTQRGIVDKNGTVVPRHYYAHFVGDYDAAAWLYRVTPEIWQDSARGKLPLSWAFNPNLAQRFPFGMHWLRRTATANDCFVTGDSGAGYINPFHLSEPREFSDLPSGWDRWERHCREWMDRLDLDVVGFVLDGNTPNMTEEGWDAYARIAPGGIVLHRNQRPPQGLHKDMPYMTMSGDLPDNESEAAARIAARGVPGQPVFSVFRSVLKSPSWYARVEARIRELDPSAMLVDLRTLLSLVRLHAEKADARARPRLDCVESSPDGSVGLYPETRSNAPFRITHFDQGACWVTPAGGRVYFRADDSFAGPQAHTCEISFTYWDSGAGRINLLVGGQEKPVGTAARSGAPQWKEARFTVDQGVQDMAVENDGEKLMVRRVKIIARMKDV